jgi:type VI protein secretion system component VasK
MRTIPLLLADSDIDQVWSFWRFMDPTTRGGLIIFGTIGLVTLLAALWAIFLRKRRRQRRSHHHAHRPSSQPVKTSEAPNDEDAPSPPEKRRHRRRSGRRHRSRNPTLAETGGLPPIRPEGPPEPQP